MLTKDISQNLFNGDYSAGQITRLVELYNSGYTFYFYINNCVPEEQIYKLNLLYGKKLYTDSDFYKLIKFLNKGVNIFTFFNEDFNTEFSLDQLMVLCSCELFKMSNGWFDYSDLLSPYYTPSQMAFLNKCLQKKTVPKQIFNPLISEQNMRILVSAYKNSLFDECLCNPLFSQDQLKELIALKEEGMDITNFADPLLPTSKIDIIATAKRYGITDVEPFKNPAFTDNDLNLFITMFRENLDFSIILNEKFNYNQRKEICDGIISKLDVSSFANPDIPFERMQIIRKFLENNYDLKYIKKSFSDMRLELIFDNYNFISDMPFILDTKLTDNEVKTCISMFKKGYTLKKK